MERHGEPHALLGGRFYVSGAIPRQTNFETGQPGHVSCGLQLGFPCQTRTLDPILTNTIVCLLTHCPAISASKE